MVKNLPTLHLAKPHLENAQLHPSQRDAIRIKNGIVDLKQTQAALFQQEEQSALGIASASVVSGAERKNQQRRAQVKQFLAMYPGMLQYYIGDTSNKQLSTEHLKNPDTKFCTSFVIVMILILTCISLFLRRDLNQQYFIQLFMEDQFYTEYSEILKRPGET
jgi:hypothetical protein